MKNYFSFLLLGILFFFPPMTTYSQTSGVSLAASLEHRELPYFNESNYINAYTLSVGMDKCLGGNWVMYVGLRYTNGKGSHTCNQCGVYNILARETGTPINEKSYYWYKEKTQKVGVPIGVKYFLPSNSNFQFFAEFGALFNIFHHGTWEGEYWRNVIDTQTIEAGPFLSDDQRTDLKFKGLIGAVAIGGEWSLSDKWAIIVKPYLQYNNYWTVGGMIGIKQVLDNGYW